MFKIIKKYTLNFVFMVNFEIHLKFSSNLLQSSLKITYESPPGIKQNLLRTYTSWGINYIEQGHAIRAQLLFILAWFHAIIQERRNFIPQGWTKFYEFSMADLRSGAAIIDNICSKKLNNNYENLQYSWTTIWGLMEYAIYGGRIDNKHDI